MQQSQAEKLHSLGLRLQRALRNRWPIVIEGTVTSGLLNQFQLALSLVQMPLSFQFRALAEEWCLGRVVEELLARGVRVIAGYDDPFTELIEHERADGLGPR